MKNSLKRCTFIFLVVILAMVVIPSKKNMVKADTSTTNTATELVWGQSYSGKLYGLDEHYDYTFTLPKSGRVSLLLSISSTNISNKKVCTFSADQGISTVTADLLAGEYKLEVIAGFWTGCQFSFTPSFTDCEETQSESYMCANNETNLATVCPIGTSYTGHFAQNDNIDVYVMDVKKTGFVSFTVISQIQKITLKIITPYEKYPIEFSNIGVGTTINEVFLVKGTYYFSLENNNYDYDSKKCGNYTFIVKSSPIPSVNLKSLKGEWDGYYGTLYVTWNPTNNIGVHGYKVQISTNKKFKKKKYTRRESPGYQDSTNFTYLKGKTYYVRVRSYVEYNGKYYHSVWSPAAKIKMRK